MELNCSSVSAHAPSQRRQTGALKRPSGNYPVNSLRVDCFLQVRFIPTNFDFYGAAGSSVGLADRPFCVTRRST